MSDFLLDDCGQVKEARYRSTWKGRADNVDLTKSSASAAQANSSLKVRARTKYEQSILDRIPERQKSNLTKPQVFGGKVYSGIGFLPAPNKIQFVDFVVGETLKQSVQLTNVSQGFNAFKVLPPPPLFRDILEVVYTPQSMMSAGMTCSITVVFTPKENVDVDTEITIQAQTGMITLPVVCRRKRASVCASTNKLDFESVVVAETSTKSVTIRNAGALAVKMSVGGDIVQMLSMSHVDTNGREKPFLSIEPEIAVGAKPTVLTLKPFSSVTVSITFSPLNVCELDSNLYLSFDNPEVDDIVVFVTGRSNDVPVFVSANSVLEFGCCLFGTLYRDTVTVQNTTSSAVKVTPDIPAALKGMLEYLPKFGFVQPNSCFDFQVKFTPNEGLGCEVDIPVKIVVADQAMPIFYRIRASMSPLGISVTPSELQLGVCTMNEMIQIPVRITNSSRISKRLGFVKLPSNVQVSPFSVFDIGAEETMEVQIAVAPPTQGQFTQSLQLISQYNETYNLPVTGHGKQPLLCFDTPFLKLPVTTIGQTCAASTMLVNCSNASQRFSFLVDKGCGVTVAPSNGMIEKGQSLPITVTFTASQQNVELTLPPLPLETSIVAVSTDTEEPKKNAAPAKKKSKAEEEQERKEKERIEEERRLARAKILAEREALLAEIAKMEPWEESTTNGLWSKHRTLLIPMYVDGWSSKATMLAVRSTVVKPTVVVYIPKDPRDASSGSNTARSDVPQQQTAAAPSSALVLSFGEVPADHCSRRSVLIQNNGDKTVTLNMKPLDPCGPFQVSRPCLPLLKPGQVTEVFIDFKPDRKAVYSQTIHFGAIGGNSVEVNAVGEGLPAALSISMDKNNPNAGSANDRDIPLNMGFALIGDRVDVPLYFTNFSPFSLNVAASFISRTITPFNPNGTLAFSLTPKQLTIPSNSKVEVIASFAPSSEGPFRGACEVEFGGEKMTKTLHFEAYGCDRGIHLALPDKDSNAVPRGPFNAFGDSPSAPGSSAASPILINFTTTESKSASKVITVVNNKGSTSGEFTIEGTTDVDTRSGWKIDPPKSSVAPATKANLTISFTPTQSLMDSLPIAKVSVISVCNFKIVLKGGTPSSDNVIFVRCKGTVCR